MHQYFGEDRFRADFNLFLTLNLALRFLPESDGSDAVREESLIIDFSASAHDDFTFGSRTTEYVFADSEIEELQAVEGTPVEHSRPARPAYANGPVATSPYPGAGQHTRQGLTGGDVTSSQRARAFALRASGDSLPSHGRRRATAALAPGS